MTRLYALDLILHDMILAAYIKRFTLIRLASMYFHSHTVEPPSMPRDGMNSNHARNDGFWKGVSHHGIRIGISCKCLEIEKEHFNILIPMA